MTLDQLTVLALGGIAVIVFDVLMSLVSRRFRVPYGAMVAGSYSIYFLVGYFAARTTATNALGVAALTTALVGLIDASAGWAVSWALGPGRAPEGRLSIPAWMATAVMVVALAGALGFVGGLASGAP